MLIYKDNEKSRLTVSKEIPDEQSTVLFGNSEKILEPEIVRKIYEEPGRVTKLKIIQKGELEMGSHKFTKNLQVLTY